MIIAVAVLTTPLISPLKASAATTIDWIAQSSRGEFFRTDADAALDMPRDFDQYFSRFLYLSDRSLKWPVTYRIETQLDPWTIRATPTVTPNVSAGTATYTWSSVTNTSVELYRANGLRVSPGYSLVRDLQGGRMVAPGAVETRRFSAQFIATRDLSNYRLRAYFEPNWGTPTPPTLPVAPSNIRCLPAPNGSDPLRPEWWGFALPAGAEVSVACEVTLTNRTTSTVEYIPQVDVVEEPAGGTATVTTPTTAIHDDPMLGRTTFTVQPPAGTDVRGYATRFWSRTVTLSWQNRIQVGAPPAACAVQRSDTPSQTVYLPNITKTLGGPSGWATPFIVQNTGSTSTALEVSFYRFSDGMCVARRAVPSLAPGTSFADVPNNDPDLPGDTQFSVVVRSFGAPIVAMVNQVQGSGATTQGLAYAGTPVGATAVSLPNVTRRFYGWDVPFIIQNLSATGALTLATAVFTAFDGSHSYTKQITIPAGRSGVIDPDFEPAFNGTSGSGLRDGTQYAVTITSAQPIAVVANAHNEQGAPAAYSHNGLSAGATTVWAPYAAKSGPNGIFSPIVVQNLGSAAASATLEFLPIGGGDGQTFTLGSLAAGGSRAFDVRFTNGDTTKGLCTTPSATCLGSGEFSLKITSSSSIAAVVLPVTATTAAAYTAAVSTATRTYLPNITRALGGGTGWTTAIYLQSVNASGATVRWYRFSDGSLITTQTLALAPGLSTKIDPRALPALADDTQYAVIVDGTGGSITAIVHEQASGGDSDMIYEGFGVASGAQ